MVIACLNIDNGDGWEREQNSILFLPFLGKARMPRLDRTRLFYADALTLSERLPACQASDQTRPNWLMKSYLSPMASAHLTCIAATIVISTAVVPLPSPAAEGTPDLIQQPYRLDTGLTSRSISFENPTGAPGAGGKAASNLGPGRKGAPAREIKPGETVQLCDIKGPGTIRHLDATDGALKCSARVSSAPGGT
jgi:hypothetical protein